MVVTLSVVDVVGCSEGGIAEVGWPEVGVVGFAVGVGSSEVGVADVGSEVLGSEEPGVDGFVVGSGVA